ncbi:phosphoadenosine phosphosulfate reductase family protein [Bacillus sp. BRMEA1]|uniref:phosphoadenosine phosphosulfate reductase domain-containing protein n=1 Tax=Neobacillus endophyticus TaxID=2738405 RepID=UPI001563F0B4|nr:phosphoadenosine phosphosulfate reductase family protein [Neobacillus endophyticus]NRD80858.1 phosphoadenosine phosphosulfate reductase family protein [Neobacillus endophyticus]
MNDIFQEIKDHMKEVYLQDDMPMALAYSGGKDSTLLLLLLWEMLASLPQEQRKKSVYLISSDTGVETPDMTDYVHRAIGKIQQSAEQQNIPIVTSLVKPNMKQSFFWKVIGKGTLVPTPNTKHRWCTHTLKIDPTKEKLKELLVQSPIKLGSQQKHQLILMLGTRNEESARRAASISRYALSEESYFSRHSDFNEILCYQPLRFVSADFLWFKLMDYETLPFGVKMSELTVQYGESILECGVKVSSEQGKACSAAGNRAGCWTCGLVSGRDPMLLRQIQEGKSKYQYLLEWKELMLRMRNDIRYREVLPRQQFNKKLKELSQDRDRSNQIGLFELDENPYIDRYHTFKRAEYNEYAPGAMTVEGRRILLQYLLFIQEQTGYKLITEYEILAILDCWKETDGIIVSRNELVPTEFSYDGELIFLPNKKVNRKLTKNPNPIFYVNIDLKMDEGELYEFLKERQQSTGKSYFFFPNTFEIKEHTLVWNQVSFVVCSKGIETSIQAHEAVFEWLGWVYGSFTEKTHKAALNHLLLSALGEGVVNKLKEEKKKALSMLPKVEVPLLEQENGQFSLAI